MKDKKPNMSIVAPKYECVDEGSIPDVSFLFPLLILIIIIFTF